MILAAEEDLKETEIKVKNEQERDYELLRGLHTNSQASGQEKGIVGVVFMQNNFTNYLDSLTEKSSDHQNKVSKLQKLGKCVHVAKEEMQEQLNAIKDLAREHSKWLLRYTNVHVHRHEKFIPIIVASKVYKAKLEKGKKAK